MTSKVFIIAEAGVNHNGSLDLAKKLIDVAVESGADAVKFQTFKTELGISKFAEKADYQKNTTNEIESQFDMIKRLELSESDHKELWDYCAYKKIIFMSTPFDLYSVAFLDKLGMDVFKIPSGEITNLPYLRCVGALGKKLIVSTGMACLAEVEQVIDILVAAGTNKDQITVLHATTEYPCPFEDVNLKSMQTIGVAFDVKVGYSDHTPGIEIPIAAVALGATVIEKHFTLDRNMEGPDHKASLMPSELKSMVQGIRNIEKALGSGIKKPSNSEIKNIVVARKSIVASKFINAGEVFTIDNLAIKRPGSGISPMRWDEVVGCVASKDYQVDEKIVIN